MNEHVVGILSWKILLCARLNKSAMEVKLKRLSSIRDWILRYANKKQLSFYFKEIFTTSTSYTSLTDL